MKEINPIRLKFRARVGEIADQVLGVSYVRETFEAAESGDKEAKAKIDAAGASGRPASAVLLDEVVPKTLQQALLAAQAAERALQSIEALEEFYLKDVPTLKSVGLLEESAVKEAVDAYYAANVPLPKTDDPSFKFIGSPNDAPYMVRAQATHQLMTEYERNEKIGVKYDVINAPVKIGNFQLFGADYLDGFKLAMVQALQEAAKVIDEAGYHAGAVDMLTIAEEVSFDAEKAAQFTPQAFAEEAVGIQERLTQNENNMYVDTGSVRRIVLDQNWQSTMIKRASQAMGLAA